MLFERIRADRLAAMKARDPLRADLLGTLMAAAAKDTKSPDDATVVKTIRSFVKSVEETITALADRDTSKQRAELAILQALLPQALDDAALDAEIDALVAALPERSLKAMGGIMQALKTKHGTALDTAVASAKVKARLQPA